jgi:nucleotide-binding universal stress UspA family protein
MQAKKILFPTDFSTVSDDALRFAAMLARDTGATLHIVHVEEPPTAYGGGETYYGVPEPDTGALNRMLEAVKPDDPKVAYEQHLLIGNPADEVIEYAKREQVDMIVMASHGRTGVLRFLMGSVAERVVREAPCPVVTVKAHQTTLPAGR